MEAYKEGGLKLRYRLLSAVLFLPVFIWLIYWKWNWLFLLFVTAIVLIALREYFKIMNQKEIHCHRILCYLGAAFLPYLFGAGNLAYPAFLLLGIFLAIWISQIFSKKDFSAVVQCVSASLLGLIYVGWLPSHIMGLKSLPDGNNLVLFVFAVTWVGDAFAYFIGVRWGKHKLIARISPNKTVEGAVAGITGSILAVIIFLIFFNISLSHYLFYFISGITLGIMAIFGDLSESILKRTIHIKDVSTIIPGHGGVLDRFDSIFFTAPVMYYLSVFFLYGQGKF